MEIQPSSPALQEAARLDRRQWRDVRQASSGSMLLHWQRRLEERMLTSRVTRQGAWLRRCSYRRADLRAHFSGPRGRRDRTAHRRPGDPRAHCGCRSVWYVKTATGPRVALWCPPRMWSVRLQETYGKQPRRFRLPMPGLVFLCLPAAQAPYVFAAKARPRTGDDQLYHCPTWNVFRNGRDCPGTHLFPRDPARIPAEFFKSQFSPTGDSHGRSSAHPDDLLVLWTDLHRQHSREPLLLYRTFGPCKGWPRQQKSWSGRLMTLSLGASSRHGGPLV
ncbi:MAG: hypothetical protein ACR2IK_01125 [Chloroflexota bacterium]